MPFLRLHYPRKHACKKLQNLAIARIVVAMRTKELNCANRNSKNWQLQDQMLTKVIKSIVIIQMTTKDHSLSLSKTSFKITQSKTNNKMMHTNTLNISYPSARITLNLVGMGMETGIRAPSRLLTTSFTGNSQPDTWAKMILNSLQTFIISKENSTSITKVILLPIRLRIIIISEVSLEGVEVAKVPQGGERDDSKS